MKKRTCWGCKALRHLQDMGCSLGYNNKGRYDSTLHVYEYAPQEECPKPMTYSKFIECTKARGYHPLKD